MFLRCPGWLKMVVGLSTGSAEKSHACSRFYNIWKLKLFCNSNNKETGYKEHQLTDKHRDLDKDKVSSQLWAFSFLELDISEKFRTLRISHNHVNFRNSWIASDNRFMNEKCIFILDSYTVYYNHITRILLMIFSKVRRLLCCRHGHGVYLYLSKWNHNPILLYVTWS